MGFFSQREQREAEADMLRDERTAFRGLSRSLEASGKDLIPEEQRAFPGNEAGLNETRWANARAGECPADGPDDDHEALKTRSRNTANRKEIEDLHWDDGWTG